MNAQACNSNDSNSNLARMDIWIASDGLSRVQLHERRLARPAILEDTAMLSCGGSINEHDLFFVLFLLYTFPTFFLGLFPDLD